MEAVRLLQHIFASFRFSLGKKRLKNRKPGGRFFDLEKVLNSRKIELRTFSK
jgi:hypothetical protein